MRCRKPFPSSTAARLFCLHAVLCAAFLLAPGSSRPVLRAQTSTPTQLVQAGNLVYEGACRFPDGGTDQTSFRYGGSALAFDPYRQSFWAVGNDQHQRVTEFSIPADCSSGSAATFKSAWFDTSWRTQVAPGATVKIGGILPQPNGDLILTAFVYYDANNTQVTSHFRRTASGTVTGPFRVDTSRHVVNPDKAGAVSGYMGWIPSEWQPVLGGPAFTGQCCVSIIGRTSLGPALTVFDPANVGSRNPIPATELLGYPIDHPTLGQTNTQGTLYNGSVTDDFTGLVFINGTRTILGIEKRGLGTVSYSAGYSAEPDEWTLLAYDALDLAAVKQGARKPYDVMPYSHWTLQVPGGSLDVTTDQQGLAYDPTSKRLFMVAHTGRTGGEHVIHVWRVTAGTSVSAPAPSPAPAPTPTIDTSNPTVSITSPASGTVVTGSLTVAATASDNIGVAGVQFALDGVNLGPEDTTPPYQASWDTTKSGNSSHTLRAWARDAAGNSSSAAVTVTVSNATAPADATPPSVTLTSPSQDTLVAGTTTLAATATDNVGVTAVQFTLNGVSIGPAVGTPFEFAWATTTVPDGVYTLRAVARDAAGNSSQSTARQVTVKNAVSLPDKDEDIAEGDGGMVDGDYSGARRAGDKARGRAQSRDGSTDGPPGRDRRGGGAPSGESSPAVRPVAEGGPLEVPASGGVGRQSLSPRPGSKASGRGRSGDPTTSGLQPGDGSAAALVECAGTNPYESSAGQIGICANGEWTLVQGIRTWGTVRQRTLSTGQTLWVIETDEAVYDVNGGVPTAYREQNLEVLFEGWFRTDLKSALEGAHVIEVRLLTVTDPQ